MRHFYFKVSLFGLLLLFCILFGVSLANTGVERIQGPLTPSSKDAQEAIAKVKVTALAAETTPAPAKAEVKAKEAKAPSKNEKETKDEPVADHDNALNHVGNKLGDLLQIAAHHGIKLFVSLFDAVLGKG
ncbi:DUF3679 domain-containing protein [Paenibacillus sp. SYP-B3998]|uniref:DUF3679 domain-containing protein n=1 Tax=Paenibacillus sp. SYP-B3998 TaxID=2678564 RepID=A0A6G3ZSR4_9BACL|nr:DUF3679 domain-containing protein [Paenibacillus sp. SYP-B3998]NEW05165.1 DUF3679 domain-containing protein [Paenibacillus sp. SYP-B3998]